MRKDSLDSNFDNAKFNDSSGRRYSRLDRRQCVIGSSLTSKSAVRKMSSITRPSFARGSNVRPPENRIVINVGGVRFETYRTTLKNIPDTRLAWLTESTSQNNADFDPDTGEYFFDRHSGVFAMILNYYRTGKLHAPMDICGPMFEEELAFWGIDEKQMESCCWPNYRTHRDAQETLAELNDGVISDDSDNDEDDIAKKFGIEEAAKPELTWWEKWKPRLWTLVEDRNSGIIGKLLASVSVCFILASIIVFMLETLPAARYPRKEANITSCNGIPVSACLINTTPHLSIVILDIIITFYFTLELAIRILLCPHRRIFLKSLLNWIDIVAVFTAYLSYVVFYAAPPVQTVVILQVLKVPRIFRIFKLTRHFSGLKILVHTMKASSKELFLLAVVFSIFVIICGTAVFICEQIIESKDNDFHTIPIGFWWALITMTTVGYGDIVPRTLPGYIVGGICAISGVLVIALPVPIIVNNFALYYTHAQARLKLPKRKKRILVGAPDALKQQMSNLDEEEETTGSGSTDDNSENESNTDVTFTLPAAAINHTASVNDTPPGITVEFVDNNDNCNLDKTKPNERKTDNEDPQITNVETKPESQHEETENRFDFEIGHTKNARTLRRCSLRPNGNAYSDDSITAAQKERNEIGTVTGHLKPGDRSPRDRRRSLTPCVIGTSDGNVASSH